MIVVALWPQSLVICVTEGEHVEFELSGAPCCPDEEGECSDCFDVRSPDLRASAVAAVAAPIVPVALPVELPAVETILPPTTSIGDAVDVRGSDVLLI